MSENKRLTILRVDGEEMGDQHDQDSVATYLRYGGLVKTLIAKSVSKKKLKSVKYLAKLQARTWLHRALSSCGGIFKGALKMRDWKMRDWNYREQETYGTPRVA